MHLVEMVKKQGLIAKLQPVRNTEKWGADDQRARAHREKRAANERAAVSKKETIVKPAEMMMRSEEELMLDVLLMARRNKRSEVVVRAKELLVLEMVKMAEPLNAWVAKATVEPAKVAMKSTSASVKAAMSGANTTHAMGPGRCGKKPQAEKRQEKDDKPDGYSFFHGVCPPGLVLLTCYPCK